MPRYKLTLDYEGTSFQGWQRQPTGKGVQNLLEKAVLGFCGSPQEVVGAGRTDAGVHAIGQVAHVDLPNERPCYNIMQGINAHLKNLSPEKSPCVSVYKVEPVSPDFHARFSASKRGYLYKIINRQAPLSLEKDRAWHFPFPLCVDRMVEAAQFFLGHHDFTSFRGAGCQSSTPYKTVDSVHVTTQKNQIEVSIEARSFLYHQVRNMVGSLVLVGSGKAPPSFIQEALLKKDRTGAGPMAPAHGLYFHFVSYDFLKES